MNDVVQTTPSKDECNIAMLAHLLGVFTGFLGALVIWLLKKDESAFIAEQSKEALNFQITIALAFLACWVLAFILIGVFLIPILILLNFVFCILAAVAVSKGQAYQYPFALRLVK
jgi:uncharacterized Tic20 family protein